MGGVGGWRGAPKADHTADNNGGCFLFVS